MTTWQLYVLLVVAGVACRREAPPRSPIQNQPAQAPGRSSERRILLVTKDNLYLEGALSTMDEPVDKVRPDEFDREVVRGGFASYSLVILDEHTPRSLPPGVAALYFDPVGDDAPFRIVARVSKPHVVAVAERHPVMEDVSLADTRFEDAEIFALDDARHETALARTNEGPIIVAGRLAGRRVMAFGFALTSSDLPLRSAFVILLRNAVSWLQAP